MLLFIDTTKNQGAQLVLYKEGLLEKQNFTELPKAEEFAQVVKDFLAQKGCQLSDLTKLSVRVGEGYFSHIRAGVVLANALAYALNLDIVRVKGDVDYKKIYSKKGHPMIEPVYSAKPNITKPKVRKWLV